MKLAPLRMTPQTEAVLGAVKSVGHSSNSQILDLIKPQIPKISATTVHRITQRLILHGLLGEGPKVNGVIMVDSNTLPHDHFVCSVCGRIKDIWLDDNLRKEVQKQTNAQILPTSMVIIGDCANCRNVM